MLTPISKLLALFVGLIACVVGLAQAQAATIIYNIDLPSFIVGTITTDGNTTTPLTGSDITNWQINQTADTVHFPSGMNPSNSTLSLVSGALTATPTELLFNFSDVAPSKLEFASTAFPGNNLQYCDATSPCINQLGASDFSLAEYVFVAPGCCSTSASSPLQSGIVEIGAATPGAVPEPSAWALMILGFAIVGGICYRRARKDRAALPFPLAPASVYSGVPLTRRFRFPTRNPKPS